MKKLLLFLSLALTAFGQPTPVQVQEATAAQVTAGTAGVGYYISPRRLGGGGVTPAGSNTFTGVNFFPAVNLTDSAMGANVIDVTKQANTKTVNANTTFTFSSAAHVAGRRFGFSKLTNSGGAAVTITIPASFSYSLGASRTTFTLPAGATIAPQWYDDGATYFLAGETVLLANLGVTGIVDVNTDLHLIEQAGVSKKITPIELVAGYLANGAGVRVRVEADSLQLYDNTLADFDTNGGRILYAQIGPFGQYQITSNAGVAYLDVPDNAAGASRVQVLPNEPYRLDANVNATATTTFATVASLEAILPVGSIDFEYILHVNPSAVGGHKYQFVSDGTFAVSSIIYTVMSVDLSTNAYVIADRVTALGSPTGQAGATSAYTIIRGTMVVTTGGAFGLQFAQQVANGTSTILAGSSAKWELRASQ